MQVSLRRYSDPGSATGPTKRGSRPVSDAPHSPCDAAGSICVAALDATPPFNLEPYSSKGPTNGTGGSLFGDSIKSDISAFANVITASYGPGQFSGTSSACPHAAGAAALY